jgi:hypothetical protein
MTIQTPIEVERGPWKGHVIRRARKAGGCEYFRGFDPRRAAFENGRCPRTIEVGDLYLAGEVTMDAGGYGQARYCLHCAGPEALAAALAAVVADPLPASAP